MENSWKKFNKETIVETHGDMYRFRDLYKGKHADLFPRARTLVERGEVIDFITNGGNKQANHVSIPYVTMNVSKIICDVPAYMISHAIGDVKTNNKHEQATEQESKANDDDMEYLEKSRDGSKNQDIIDLQQETIEHIVNNSKLRRKHRSNIVQLQVDGGIVGVPIKRGDQISIEFKERNVYYEHPDGLGADLVYERPDLKEENGDTDYVHIYTEREEKDSLHAYHRLYKRNRDGDLEQVTDEAVLKVILEDYEDDEYKGRKRRFMDYLGNNVTFMDPYGVSELYGQEGKQEEINWTATRMAMTMERNGKPRIAFTSAMWDRIEEIAEADDFGDGAGGENANGARSIDFRELEVIEMDENGRSMEIIQIDITKIGDMNYIKDIMRAMLAETQTSEKATELLSGTSGTSYGTSGVARFYELATSVMKARSIAKEYVEFLQNLFESALWLANKENDNVIIEKPIIMLQEMLPTFKNEKDTNNIAKFAAKAQSLETTVRQLNPDKSEDWIDQEVERLEMTGGDFDTFALANGRQSLTNMLGNRNPAGQPLTLGGQPVTPASTDPANPDNPDDE